MATNSAANTPTGTTGTVLQGQGAGSALALSTATYPATTTINQILYSSAANTIGGISTANSGVMVTSSGGVPSIDTTNFAVLTTGLQLKGNNTNTAPPSGFIGQLLTATATTGSLTSNVTVNITSVSLTAGIWDVEGYVEFNTTGTIAGNTQYFGAISATTASLTGTGENGTAQIGGVLAVNGVNGIGVSVGATRCTLSGTTIIYLNCRGFSSVTFTSVTATGIIRAVRVG